MFFSQSHLPHDAFDQNIEADQNLNTNRKVFFFSQLIAW